MNVELKTQVERRIDEQHDSYKAEEQLVAAKAENIYQSEHSKQAATIHKNTIKEQNEFKLKTAQEQVAYYKVLKRSMSTMMNTLPKIRHFLLISIPNAGMFFYY